MDEGPGNQSQNESTCYETRGCVDPMTKQCGGTWAWCVTGDRIEEHVAGAEASIVRIGTRDDRDVAEMRDRKRGEHM